MCDLTRPLEASTSVPEILGAVSRVIATHLTPLPLVELAGLRIESRDDLEHWIDRIQLMGGSSLMSADQEDRLNGLLSCLLVASIRANMLAKEAVKQSIAA
jgi:hypothetical protein